MADEKFELVSSYQPTGDQPQAIETLVEGVQRGDRCQTLLGVTGSGKTFTMANVIARCNRPTLVLAHNKTLAAQLCTEFRSFFPNNAVEYFVSYYDYYQPEAYIPSTDTYIEKDSAINDEIVEFSELQNFLDVPLKNYSSGMVARIGFAIATITKPDILIADEVLSVGDFLFQQKCEKRMKELMAGGTTVILVSHSIEQIERMCSKVAWLSHGHLKMNGDTETVCAAYKATQRGEA